MPSTSRRRWTGGAAAALALTTGVGLLAQRASVERHVLVTVVDRQEAPVANLTAADFVVREEGLAREILRVGPAAGPMHIALLVDDSQAAQPLIAELRQGVSTFLTQMGGKDHQIAIWTFGERPTRIADFTNIDPILRKAAERILPRSGAGAHMLDAIVEAAGALRRKEAARPVIVAFVVESGPEFSSPTHEQVEHALDVAGASLWVVALQSRTGAVTTEQRERAAVMSDVARASGGGLKVALSAQSIDLSFRTVTSWLNSQYDVTYARPESLVPPEKREVTVKREGLRVMASTRTPR
jgi:VWFA-related protein